MFHIDFTSPTGPMKPMHAINNAPFYGTDTTLFPTLKAAGIPYSRLHDTGGRFGGNCYVDIDNVFPDFDADENDPASYTFAHTDWLLGKLKEQGVEPFYRLGVTIENDVLDGLPAFRIYPPKDYAKWARICEHIILHYNEGWADGFHMGITYWEIWNEAENKENPMINQMWRGSFEEYCRFYVEVAGYLKGRFPHLMIGGYASCGVYYSMQKRDPSIVGYDWPEAVYHDGCVETFLSYITDPAHKAPLDFFSWHSYSEEPERNVLGAEIIRELLNKYGLGHVPAILDEWNPGIARRGTSADAARVAAVMCTQQYADTAMLMYYNGAIHGRYQGMYEPVHYTTYPAYDAFFAFNVLYQLGEAVKASSDMPNLYIAAARGKGKKAILIANTGEERGAWVKATDAEERFTVKVTDAHRRLTKTEVASLDTPIIIPGYSIVLLESE